jgi:cytochrome c oxidase assembly protein subunit 11
MTSQVEQKNTKLVLKLAMVAVAMFGFGYALVPIYNVFCEVTGLGGKTNTSAVQEVVYQVDKAREITVEFLTTVNEATPLLFYAQSNNVKVHPGEYKTVNFYAENKTDRKIVVRAIDSVSPSATKFYFEKAVCFCFSQQTFNPHEKKTLSVRFVVKPDLPAEYQTITLSYTFFDNTGFAVKK